MLCVILFLEFAVFGCFLTIVPSLIQNYIANEGLGPIDCNLRLPQHEKICSDADSTAAEWSTWSHSVYMGLSFLFGPLVGGLTDVFGRRILFRVSSCLAFLPSLSLCLFSLGYISPFPYLLTYAAQGLCLQPSICMACVADWSTVRTRTAKYGMAIGSLSLALVVSPLAAMALSTPHVAMLALASAVLATALALGLPESLPPSQRRAAMEWRKVLNPFSQMRQLGRSRLFRRLALCNCTAMLDIMGLANVSIYYLKLPQTYYVQNSVVATLVLLIGLVGVVSQVVLLRPIVAYLQERRTLVLALVLTLTRMLLFAFGPVHDLSVVYATAVLAGGGLLVFPITTSLISSHASDDEQGSMQGAMYGARSLAELCGTMGYGSLFRFFTADAAISGGYFCPRVIFYIASFVALIALVAALSIPRHPKERVLFYERSHMQRKLARRQQRRQQQRALLIAAAEEAEARSGVMKLPALGPRETSLLLPPDLTPGRGREMGRPFSYNSMNSSPAAASSAASAPATPLLGSMAAATATASPSSSCGSGRSSVPPSPSYASAGMGVGAVPSPPPSPFPRSPSLTQRLLSPLSPPLPGGTGDGDGSNYSPPPQLQRQDSEEAEAEFWASPRKTRAAAAVLSSSADA